MDVMPSSSTGARVVPCVAFPPAGEVDWLSSHDCGRQDARQGALPLTSGEQKPLKFHPVSTKTIKFNRQGKKKKVWPAP